MTRDNRKVFGLAVLTMTALSGCSQVLKEQELAAVAKDWALTIRASQIIPIYPLREDLEVGDVFLVTIPIQRQQEEYEQKGFLVLEQQLVRLDLEPMQPASTDPFKRYYHDSFAIDSTTASSPATNVPDLWRFPSGTTPWLQSSSGERTKGGVGWTRAPRVFFPTYTFKVQSGMGFAAAIPIQSVPVGMAVMGTDAATGSAQIKDAFTYGLSLDALQPFVSQWAPNEAPRLEALRAAQGRPIYVRVVSRVFLAGGVSVSLTNDRALSADLRAGNAPDFNFPPLTQGDVDGNMRRIGAATTAPAPASTGGASTSPTSNAPATTTTPALTTTSPPSVPTPATTPTPTVAGASAVPSPLDIGGRIKFTLATSRSVTAEETFDRPLVVGYLAFDYPVMPDGTLGEPVATRDQMIVGEAPVAGKITSSEAYIGLCSRAAATMDESMANKWLDTAAKMLGSDFQKAFKNAIAVNPAAQPGAQIWQRFNQAISTQRVSSEQAASVLRVAWNKGFQE